MRISPLVLSILLFSSCRQSLPEGVLPPDKMRAVYWDLMQAEELSGEYAGVDTSFIRLHKSDSLYAAVFQVHDISREAFAKSEAYYSSKPKLLRDILDSLHEKGERLRLSDTPKRKLTNIDTAIKQRKRLADSSNAALPLME